MHTVMIVDDDRIIRMGLLKTVPWEANGFKLIGEAGDGEQALAVIKEQMPQIVVSDIRMPFMDGLELARRTKKVNPSIKFIFLTGFEDFAYAKEAITVGAVDYLLKPVDKEQLIEKVKKAAAEWDKEQGDKVKIDTAQPFLREMLLQSILTGKADTNELITKGKALGVDLDHSHFAVMLAKIDDYYMDKAHPLIARNDLKLKLTEALEKELFAESAGGVFPLEGDTLGIIYGADSEECVADNVRIVAENMLRVARETLSTTLTIGIGSVQAGFEHIDVSFDEAHYVMNFRHVIGKNTIIGLEDLDSLVSQVQTGTEQVSKEALLDKIRLGLVTDALQVIGEIEAGLRGSQLPLSEVRLMAVDLLLAIFKGAENWAGDWAEKHQAKKAEYYDSINRMQTISEIMELMRALTDSLAQFMTDENINQRTDIIDEVTNYIEEHYADHGLSLQDIGDHVHMNPIYLSVLFKKKKKITFTGFLLQIRMKKAMEMLRCQDLKTYEVADLTGYSSPEYFGACFKKYTGCSPLEFRNKT